MHFKKIAAAVAAVGALTFLAACGDDSGDTASTNQTVSSTVPDGFPKDIPVVGTQFKAYDSPVEDAVGMEVVGATATSFPDAVDKLRAAKYDEVVSPGKDPSQQNATFSNEKYTVAIVSSQTGGKYRLTYSVIIPN
ncbi:hypothetical protein nbrc107696_15870 [Gordonia spumicola]|uniref:Lipoprotein n=1 Tax=Gordonia spumicola TaxID=589161 RepID=A0A7I9V7S0_9ACTN|nr:hypothetical protein [Gordonia spumicola]GEE01141.1 hypothetical protein nbrc107696_15870 [Gordonia spumicola]